MFEWEGIWWKTCIELSVRVSNRTWRDAAVMNVKAVGCEDVNWIDVA
jgi:hypothetical protein